MKSKNNKKPKIVSYKPPYYIHPLVSFLIVFGFFVSGGIGYFIGQHYTFTKKDSSTIQPELFSYEPETTLIPTVKVQLQAPIEEQTGERSLQEILAELFSLKYNKTRESTVITISENTETHAKGGVHFEGELGGAWFLATKENGKWFIVQDGNGTVMCDTIEQYNFPVSMVPECVEPDGTLRAR